MMFERMTVAFVHHYYVTVVLTVFSWTSDYCFLLTIHASSVITNFHKVGQRAIFERCLRRIPALMLLR